MITGYVNAEREAIVRLRVRGSEPGQEHEIEAVVDTGFTGFLTLPPSLIAALGLPWRGFGEAVLGDGSLHTFDVYRATVNWDGQERTIEVDAADTEPLVGMGLIYGHELRIAAVDGGPVTIGPLP